MSLDERKEKIPKYLIRRYCSQHVKFNNAFRSTVSEESNCALLVPTGYLRSFTRMGLAAMAVVKFSQGLQRKLTCPPGAPSLMFSTSFLPKSVVMKKETGGNLEVDTLSNMLS